MTKPDSMPSKSTGPRGDKIHKHLQYNSSTDPEQRAGKVIALCVCVGGQQLHTEIVANAINLMKSHFI